jgi:hypothetical protein
MVGHIERRIDRAARTGVFPSPLWGGARGGGREMCAYRFAHLSEYMRLRVDDCRVSATSLAPVREGGDMTTGRRDSARVSFA